MKNLFENKKIIICCILLIIIVFGIAYLIPKIKKNNFKFEETDYSFLKNYSVNEYVPVTVNQEAMAKIYVTQYKNLMVGSPDKAYSYLNEDYRNKKFGSFDNFIQYVKDIQSKVFFEYEVDEYSVQNINGNEIFYVKDSANDLYIFKEKSIMQYEVYLDNNLVKIK